MKYNKDMDKKIKNKELPITKNEFIKTLEKVSKKLPKSKKKAKKA